MRGPRRARAEAVGQGDAMRALTIEVGAIFSSLSPSEQRTAAMYAEPSAAAAVAAARRIECGEPCSPNRTWRLMRPPFGCGEANRESASASTSASSASSRSKSDSTCGASVALAAVLASSSAGVAAAAPLEVRSENVPSTSASAGEVCIATIGANSPAIDGRLISPPGFGFGAGGGSGSGSSLGIDGRLVRPPTTSAALGVNLVATASSSIASWAEACGGSGCVATSEPPPIMPVTGVLVERRRDDCGSA